MEKKIQIVKEMVKNGYILFDETIENFAKRFTLKDLEMFSTAFKEFKKL